MSVYAVGDIQGCYKTLRALLQQIQFQPAKDTLWCAGDLINRGPDNVDTLNYLMSLPNLRIVLGNHDLHFLAIAEGVSKPHRGDTISDLLDHSDLPNFVDWLAKQPILVVDDHQKLVMVHAGLPAIWSLKEAKAHARTIEQALQGEDRKQFLKNMYGNTPSSWRQDLNEADRLRIMTNFFTRLRYYQNGGHLELTHKADQAPAGFKPWFLERHPSLAAYTILFGHWAALGNVTRPGLFGLDSGCVWGRHLTALRLDDGQLFKQPNREG